MVTKQEAEEKIAAAESGCAKAQHAWSAAAQALSGSVSTNGYGIYHDRFALRSKLEDARAHIQEGLDALDKIEWPTSAEYDVL